MSTTIVDDIHNIAAKVEPYVAFVEVAQQAVGLGGPAVTGALAVIKAGLEALARGSTGATADEVTAELRGLLARVTAGEAADDAEADAIVAARRAAEKTGGV